LDFATGGMLFIGGALLGIAIGAASCLAATVADAIISAAVDATVSVATSLGDTVVSSAGDLLGSMISAIDMPQDGNEDKEGESMSYQGGNGFLGQLLAQIAAGAGMTTQGLVEVYQSGGAQQYVEQQMADQGQTLDVVTTTKVVDISNLKGKKLVDKDGAVYVLIRAKKLARLTQLVKQLKRKKSSTPSRGRGAGGLLKRLERMESAMMEK
jgi:hypothetical protein